MLIDVEYPPGSGNRIRAAGMPWRTVARQGPGAARRASASTRPRWWARSRRG